MFHTARWNKRPKRACPHNMYVIHTLTGTHTFTQTPRKRARANNTHEHTLLHTLTQKTCSQHHVSTTCVHTAFVSTAAVSSALCVCHVCVPCLCLACWWCVYYSIEYAVCSRVLHLRQRACSHELRAHGEEKVVQLMSYACDETLVTHQYNSSQIIIMRTQIPNMAKPNMYMRWHVVCGGLCVCRVYLLPPHK